MFDCRFALRGYLLYGLSSEVYLRCVCFFDKNKHSSMQENLRCVNIYQSNRQINFILEVEIALRKLDKSD